MARPKSKSQAVLDNSASSSSCHINRVANEVLAEILHFCITKTARAFEQEKNSGYGQHRSIENRKFVYYADILVVSHVDRRWRTVSIGNPSLWSRVYVNVPFSMSPEITSSVEKLVSLYLQRSNNTPLDISLILPDFFTPGPWFGDEEDDSEEDDIDPIPILPLFLQHAHRWRSATFQLHETRALEKLHSRFPATLPLLEELDVRCVPRDSAGNCSFPSFEGPRMRKLVVERFSANDIGSSFLREISLDWVDPNTVMSFLADASAQCRAKVLTMFIPELFYGTSSATSYLKSLSFTSTDELDCDLEYPLDGVLDNLTLPVVQELVFIEERSDSEVPFPAKELLSLLGRSSSCSCLAKLCIKGHRISDEDLLKILGQLHSLRKLMVKEANMSSGHEKFCPLTERFFAGLVGDSHGSCPVAPNLLRVQFEMRSDANTVTKAYNACMSFLESRRRDLRGPNYITLQNQVSTAPLLQAKILLPRRSSNVLKASKEVLARLRAGGLAVKAKANL